MASKTTKTQAHTGDFTTMDAAWDALEAAVLAHQVLITDPASPTKVRDRAWRRIQTAGQAVGDIIGWSWWNLFRLVAADVADIIENSTDMVVDHDTLAVTPTAAAAEAAREQLAAILAPAAEQPAPACAAHVLVQQSIRGRDKGRWWASCTRHGILTREGSDSWCDTASEAEALGRDHGPIGHPSGLGRAMVPAARAELTYRAHREYAAAA